MMLSDICRSVTYIGPKSTTERPRKNKIGTEVAHVTRDSDTTSKVKRSRSPGRFAHRRVGASGGCSGGRGNVLAMGNCSYKSARRHQALRRPSGGKGQGHIVAAAHLQLVIHVIPWVVLLVGRQEGHPTCKKSHTSNLQRFFFESPMGPRHNLEWSLE